MILLALSGEMIFLLPENMILHLRRKTKDHLSQKKKKKKKKIHGNMTFYSNVLKRWSFKKKLCLAMIYLLLIAWQDVFFTRKHDIFSLDEK